MGKFVGCEKSEKYILYRLMSQFYVQIATTEFMYNTVVLSFASLPATMACECIFYVFFLTIFLCYLLYSIVRSKLRHIDAIESYKKIRLARIKAQYILQVLHRAQKFATVAKNIYSYKETLPLYKRNIEKLHLAPDTFIQIYVSRGPSDKIETSPGQRSYHICVLIL